MEDRQLHERTAALEAHTKNVFHQLDEIKEEMGKLQRLPALCEGILAKLSSFEEKLGDVTTRLKQMESAPTEAYFTLRRTLAASIITAAVSGIVGALCALLGGA